MLHLFSLLTGDEINFFCYLQKIASAMISNLTKCKLLLAKWKVWFFFYIVNIINWSEDENIKKLFYRKILLSFSPYYCDTIKWVVLPKILLSFSPYYCDTIKWVDINHLIFGRLHCKVKPLTTSVFSITVCRIFSYALDVPKLIVYDDFFELAKKCDRLALCTRNFWFSLAFCELATANFNPWNLIPLCSWCQFCTL